MTALAAGMLVVTVSACGASGHKTFHQQVLAYLGQQTVNATHPCGYLDAGKGWRVHTSPGVGCGPADHLVRRFFSRCLRAQRQPGKACGVIGYTCIELPRQPDRGVVWCATAISSVTAISNS